MSDFSVSVVIPLYNKAQFIRRTLDTVLAQTLTPDEVIIVDDGSTDGSPDKIADLIGDRVRLLHQSNAGPGPARNRGASEATGEWIALLDGDDLWSPNHLETLAKVVAGHPEVTVVATRHERIRVWAPLPATESTQDRTEQFDYFHAACGQEGLSASSTAIKRHALIDSGGFGAFMPGEDTELWFRLALDNRMARSSRRTSFYTQETGGIMDSGVRRTDEDEANQSLLTTIARTLADPAHAAHHDAIRALRSHLMVNGVKQELFHGNAQAARRLIRDCGSIEAEVPSTYRLLSLLPSRLLKVGVRTAARVRNRIARKVRRGRRG